MRIDNIELHVPKRVRLDDLTGCNESIIEYHLELLDVPVYHTLASDAANPPLPSVMLLAFTFSDSP
jgi:hypothetical protein